MKIEQHSLPGLSAIGREFPATQRCIYLDVANQGLISRTTKASCETHLLNRMYGKNDEAEMLQLVERTRVRFAKFIGADRDEIAITKNASEGINIIANAIDWRAGDNVVVCPKLEHANNVLPWLRVKESKGAELRAVEPDQGHIPADAMVRAIDSRTRVVALSTVTMIPGFRTNLAPIVHACKKFGAFLIADATQSAGILHTDVAQLGLDGLAVSTVKGLMGFYGLGFLYCRMSWAERFMPAYVARFSVDLGDAPAPAPILNGFRLRRGAPRFDIGHYNFPGVAAAYSSLGQLLEIGTVVIEANVRRLAARLASGLLELGLPVCGGSPGTHTGSIVAVGDVRSLNNGIDADERIESLYNYLMQHNVIVSVRRGFLRFSLHHYCSDENIDRVISLAKMWLGTTHAAQPS
jgi:cysteine desulfurase/selenocysteine lyase